MSKIKTHGVVADATWENFTPQEHDIWKLLFQRQSKLLKNRVTEHFLAGLLSLKIASNRIPKFEELNDILDKATGFSIVPVSGLIPDALFFQLLSERKFPSTCFIRKAHQLDYLEEPDIFHDIFGHVPLLVNPIFADFMELFGHVTLEAIKLGLLEQMARLYWFTVEFGLITNSDGLRIYGAGIVSSSGESIYSLESNVPLRLKFDLKRIMRTKYATDDIQKNYFVLEDFKELFSTVKNLDLLNLVDQLNEIKDIEAGMILDNEQIIA